MFLNAFRQVGNDLFVAGLNNSHSGNLSLRIDDKSMLITRTGCMLHHIDYQDLITTCIEKEDSQSCKASREIPVHRSIYLSTNAKAIVHAHSPYTVAISLNKKVTAENRLMLKDAEGVYYFPGGVALIRAANPIASEEVAKLIIPAFELAPIAIIAGHGSFAIGESLEEAYRWTASLEHSVKISSLLMNSN